MPGGQPGGTNRFRCEGCGRHFNTRAEFTEHQQGCLAAQQSGSPNKPVVEHPREEGEDRDWVSVP